MRNKVLIGLLSILCSVFYSKAQKPFPSDTFRVVKSYQPTIIDAQKIDFKIEIEDTFKLETKLQYDFIQKQLPYSYSFEPIPAAKIKGEPLVKLYRGYARLGLGNALLPFGEIYYSSLRSKKMSWGVHASYFNMDEVNDIEGSDRSNAHLEVFGKRFWKTNTFETKLRYEQSQLNYYGDYQLPSLQNIETPSSELEQQYDRFTADFELTSTVKDSFNLRHKANLHFGMIGNEGGENEFYWKAALHLGQFNNQEFYELDFDIHQNQYDLDRSDDNTLISLRPQISTIGERFKVKVGLGLYLNNEESTDFHFYPLAEVNYNVIEDVLIPYAGLKGGIRQLNYQQLTLENPFIAERFDLKNSNEKFQLYAGLRGTLSSKLSFNLNGSFNRTDDAYFYVQEFDSLQQLTNDFQLIYDELDELQLKGEMIYRFSDALKFMATAQYFNFDLEQQAEAWHRPEVKANLSASYNLRDKIILKADLFYWGEQKARSVDATTANGNDFTFNEFTVNTLDAIFDANLGIEYRYTKRLSAFIQFNNIGGVNYKKYQNYPLQGFNVWGGFTYGF